jgi:hypothetical protein
MAVKKRLVAAMIGLMMVTSAGLSWAEEQNPGPEQSSPPLTARQDQCSELVALLADQEQKNSREFRQLKRDLAALSQQVAEPGMREIFGGIGYILGLFGVAAYVASRKKDDRGGT